LSISSNEYSLHLVERHLLGPPVVKLRRARAGVVRHLRGFFERAAVLQISGDAGRAESMIADARGDTGGTGAPLDHRIGVRLGQGSAGQLAGRAAVSLEEKSLRVARKPRADDILM
jgi:hypothetical protein